MTPDEQQTRQRKRTLQTKRLRPFLLTERDTQLLSFLLECGGLTTEQTRALFFTSAHRTRKRLRQLWQHKLIVRHSRPVIMGEGSTQYVYTLGVNGHRLLFDRRSEFSHAGYRRRSMLSEHAIRINDLRVVMMTALRRSDEVTLHSWRHDRELSFPVRLLQAGKIETMKIIPDGFVVLSLRGRKFGYFIEVDRGTTDHRRIRNKLLGYLSLWEREISSELGVRSFRVLIVTETEQRLSNLLTTLASSQRSQRRDIINMTCWPRFSLVEPHKLFSSIWQTIDSFGEVRNVSPLPSLTSSTLPLSSSKPLVRGPDAGAR